MLQQRRRLALQFSACVLVHLICMSVAASFGVPCCVCCTVSAVHGLWGKLLTAVV
jgi:hypothetical protein